MQSPSQMITSLTQQRTVYLPVLTNCFRRKVFRSRQCTTSFKLTSVLLRCALVFCRDAELDIIFYRLSVLGKIFLMSAEALFFFFFNLWMAQQEKMNLHCPHNRRRNYSQRGRHLESSKTTALIHHCGSHTHLSGPHSDLKRYQLDPEHNFQSAHCE